MCLGDLNAIINTFVSIVAFYLCIYITPNSWRCDFIPLTSLALWNAIYLMYYSVRGMRCNTTLTWFSHTSFPFPPRVAAFRSHLCYALCWTPVQIPQLPPLKNVVCGLSLVSVWTTTKYHRMAGIGKSHCLWMWLHWCEMNDQWDFHFHIEILRCSKQHSGKKAIYSVHSYLCLAPTCNHSEWTNSLPDEQNKN